jgi:xylose dehydrogenase (NAD/NADP)
MGCYCINTARFLIGAEPARVYAEQEIGAHGVDERTTATVYFPGGELLQFDANLYLDEGHFEQGCTVYGTSGNIYLPHAFTQIEVLRFGRMVETELVLSDHAIGAGQSETFRIGAVHAWRLEAEYFAGRILAGQAIELPGENGTANMRVVDAVVRSARAGRPVEIGASWREE